MDNCAPKERMARIEARVDQLYARAWNTSIPDKGSLSGNLIDRMNDVEYNLDQLERADSHTDPDFCQHVNLVDCLSRPIRADAVTNILLVHGENASIRAQFVRDVLLPQFVANEAVLTSLEGTSSMYLYRMATKYSKKLDRNWDVRVCEWLDAGEEGAYRFRSRIHVVVDETDSLSVRYPVLDRLIYDTYKANIPITWVLVSQGSSTGTTLKRIKRTFTRFVCDGDETVNRVTLYTHEEDKGRAFQFSVHEDGPRQTQSELVPNFSFNHEWSNDQGWSSSTLPGSNRQTDVIQVCSQRKDKHTTAFVRDVLLLHLQAQYLFIVPLGVDRDILDFYDKSSDCRVGYSWYQWDNVITSWLNRHCTLSREHRTFVVVQNFAGSCQDFAKIINIELWYEESECAHHMDSCVEWRIRVWVELNNRSLVSHFALVLAQFVSSKSDGQNPSRGYVEIRSNSETNKYRYDLPTTDNKGEESDEEYCNATALSDNISSNDGDEE